MKKTTILSLYQVPQTVLTLKDISLMLPEIPYNNLKRRLSYFAKLGHLKKLRRGVYAKEPYDVLELANKVYAPSYISLETVLQRAGVIFQYYEGIFAVSYLSRTVEVSGHTIIYRKMKKDILLNKQGIEEQGNVVIASPERAFLDAVFFYKNYHFDNLGALNWDKIMELKDLYRSGVFTEWVGKYYQMYKEDHA